MFKSNLNGISIKQIWKNCDHASVVCMVAHTIYQTSQHNLLFTI